MLHVIVFDLIEMKYQGCIIKMHVYFFRQMNVFNPWIHRATVLPQRLCQLTGLLEMYTLELVILKLKSMIDILSIYCEITLRWMSQDLADD